MRNLESHVKDINFILSPCSLIYHFLFYPFPSAVVETEAYLGIFAFVYKYRLS